MPIKIQNDLPARAELERENIFVMDETRALSQDIRPLQILILNLMPIKQDTETQLFRAFSNTPLQVDITLMHTSSHQSKNTSSVHLNKFYVTFPEVEHKMFDGMISSIQQDTIRLLYHVRIEQKVEREQVAQVTGTNKDESAKGPVRRAEGKVYPNDPCPCGSGKKYKQCCGRKVLKA